MIPSNLQFNIDQLERCLSWSVSGGMAKESTLKSVTDQVTAVKKSINENASLEEQLKAWRVLKAVEKGWGNEFVPVQAEDRGAG